MKTDSETFTLTTGASSMRIDADGQLQELTGNGTAWHAQPGPFWQMTLQAPSDPSVLGNHRKAQPTIPPTIEQSDTTLVLRYTDLEVDGEPANVDLDATITAKDGDFLFTFAVANRSTSWTVREIRAPMVAAPLPDKDAPALLWPAGAGTRFANARDAHVLCEPYPMRLIMPWMALDKGESGLYVASHDGSLQTLTLNADARRIPDAIALSVSVFPFCSPGEAAETAPIVVRPYAGTWHEAATYYRRWADTWYQPVERPEWVRDITGWQLVIMKQQNGEIHWPYTDIDRLVELGEENGLNVLGLFGWTEGGHDRHYPVYETEPAMGGETALREGIEKAHAAGQKVILYTNGQLRDIFTEWHDQFGMESATLSERGDAFGESWIKYHDAPPRRMTYGCQSSRLWSDRLLDLAKQVESLGADGIIFDQLGSCHPMFCFSDKHDHGKPSLATGPGVAANMARVQHEMHAINPDFIVIVEHVADAVNQHVDFTHGCGLGFTPGHREFAEMLRFTLPEILTTQRHRAPIMDRNTANWACLYGYAHEVEIRYWPDRLYIDQGIVPDFCDYERISGALSEIEMMRAHEPRAASAYLREVTEFELRHADLFRDGKFRDTLGFSTDNPEVKAKAYVHGDAVGIILWNPTDQPQTVQVSVDDAEFSQADAPGGEPVNPDTPIPPESVRLMRYARSDPER